MFAVWEVYGYSRGSVALLAIYPYRDATRATEHAERVAAGYVLRSRSHRSLDNRVELAIGDTKTASNPQPAKPVVVEQPAILPPLILPRAETWC